MKIPFFIRVAAPHGGEESRKTEKKVICTYLTHYMSVIHFKLDPKKATCDDKWKKSWERLFVG